MKTQWIRKGISTFMYNHQIYYLNIEYHIPSNQNNTLYDDHNSSNIKIGGDVLLFM